MDNGYHSLRYMPTIRFFHLVSLEFQSQALFLLNGNVKPLVTVARAPNAALPFTKPRRVTANASFLFVCLLLTDTTFPHFILRVMAVIMDLPL